VAENTQNILIKDLFETDGIIVKKMFNCNLFGILKSSEIT